MWFALAAILMLFMGLTSAYVMRRGLDPQWEAILVPRIALVNAALLLASSLTLEIGARRMTCILGLAFIAGQIFLWRQLAAAGLYLSTNPHASFIYLLTALHALHLLGGIIALSRVRGPGVAVVALYWHFMAGLWIYLLLVLFVWIR